VALLVLPGTVFLLAVFGYPLVEMAIRSLTDPSPATYRVFVDSPIYLRTLFTTFETALLVTAACLLLGYPYAYAMNMATPRVAAVLGLIVLMPFWTSMLVRTYAWTVWLQDSGVINTALQELGVIGEPLPLMRNVVGVAVGMTQILLPYMVLPIYAVMRRVDPELQSAAEGLGASPSAAFMRVFLPLSFPGVGAGCLLVFVLALGFYIAPALLGGPQNTMLSQLIVDKVSLQLQFGVGSAVGMVLLAVTLAILALGGRLAPFHEHLGGDE
jgi:putative spermidine/putrescine transport system permease protein